MRPEDLTVVARWLADDSRTGTAKHAFRRRSVSTSYYALFHALALLCADELLGPATDLPERSHVYRALDHIQARVGLHAVAKQSGDSGLKQIASVFEGLQNARHEADYSEDVRLTAAEAMEWRDASAEAIRRLASLTPGLRRALAIRLLFRNRAERR